MVTVLFVISIKIFKPEWVCLGRWSARRNPDWLFSQCLWWSSSGVRARHSNLGLMVQAAHTAFPLHSSPVLCWLCFVPCVEILELEPEDWNLELVPHWYMSFISLETSLSSVDFSGFLPLKLNWKSVFSDSCHASCLCDAMQCGISILTGACSKCRNVYVIESKFLQPLYLNKSVKSDKDFGRSFWKFYCLCAV